MPAIINFKATTSDYPKDNQGCSIGPFNNAIQVAFIIANASVYMQLARKTKAGVADWDKEDLPYPPYQGGFDDVQGIRFKSFDPAKSAVIVAVLFFANDPLPVSGQPFSTLLNPNGTIAQNPLPSGIELFWPMPTPPSWAVTRDGSTYDGTLATYVGLWNVIGNTYGGTGQNNFEVPDHLGRTIVGLGSNSDVNAVTKNEGLAAGFRTPKHNSSVTAQLNSPVSHNSGSASGATIVDDTQFNSGSLIQVQVSVGPGGTRPIDTPAYGVALPIITL